MSPVGIVCQLRKNQMVPKCEVFLTLKNECEKLYHRKYKMMILREIFSFISKYSLLMMNFKRMAFFLFSFFFGCLKSEFLMVFFFR